MRRTLDLRRGARKSVHCSGTKVVPLNQEAVLKVSGPDRCFPLCVISGAGSRCSSVTQRPPCISVVNITRTSGLMEMPRRALRLARPGITWTREKSGRVNRLTRHTCCELAFAKAHRVVQRPQHFFHQGPVVCMKMFLQTG